MRKEKIMKKKDGVMIGKMKIIKKKGRRKIKRKMSRYIIQMKKPLMVSS